MKKLVMFSRLCFGIVGLAVIASANAYGPGRLQDSVPAGGVSLLPSDSLSAFGLFGQAEKAKLETIDVSGQPFRKAFRCTTIKAPANQWELQLGTWLKVPVKKGDVMLLRFYVRSVKGQAETGEARTQAGMATGGPQWASSMTASVNIPKDWKLIEVPFAARYDTDAKGSIVVFDMGFAPQSFEIGGIQLLDYRNTKSISDLPWTRSDYPGQEEDAPWRKEALKRIDKIRKGALKVNVVDSAGKPISNASVEIKMRRHAFKFGSTVAADFLVGSGPDNDKYRQIVLENYTATPIENHLKWPFWESWGRQDGDKAVDWLAEHDIYSPITGPLIWGGWSNLPDDLKAKQSDRDYLDKRIKDNIAKEMSAYRRKVSEWEVINEPYVQHDLWILFGTDKMAEYFREARKVDPKARLFINDYPELDGSAMSNQHLSHYYSYIDSLVKAQAPLGGIGFQCHFGGNVVPPERLLSGLDKFAKFGLPIAITEFDMNTVDEDLQRRYMRDFLTATFSHPAIDEILMWGFWEEKHWMPNAALYRKDWSIKPNGKVWQDLVKHEWWTNASGKTDSHGQFVNRSFYGVYEVKATVGGKTQTGYFSFTKDGSPIVLKMDGRSETPPKWLSAQLTAEAARKARAVSGWSMLGSTDFNFLSDPSNGSAMREAVVGQPFDSAFKFKVLRPTTNPWDVQALIVTNEEIHKGDRLKLSFYVRSNGADSGKVKVNFQTGGPEYAVLDGTTVVPTSAWTKVERSFTSPIDRASGGVMFVVQMGYQAQEFEVGGVSVVNFGRRN